MKLWMLEPIETPDSPHRTFDCMAYFVVRAENESVARQLASEHAKDESAECWLNSKWSACDEYTFPTVEGEADVVWMEFTPG